MTITLTHIKPQTHFMIDGIIIEFHPDRAKYIRSLNKRAQTAFLSIVLNNKQKNDN